MTQETLKTAKALEREIEEMSKVLESPVPVLFVGGYECRINELYRLDEDTSTYYAVYNALKARLESLKNKLAKL
jgi:chaperonin cofactor prefoldin